MHAPLARAAQPDMSYYRSQRPEMLPFIPAGAQRFLELGCGAGGFGALLRASRPHASVTGVEIHAASAQEARARLDQVIEQPIDGALASMAPASFDCVICNDVLEHLVDPWAVLRQIKTILQPHGAVVASIPNVRHFPVFKKYLLGADWEYEKWGVLDQTHLRFFTRTSIARLFAQSGLRASRIEGIFGQPLPWKAALLNGLLGGKLSDMQYERFACVAVQD